MGEFLETWKKVGSVFGKKLINLEKDTSVFEKLLKNLKTVGSVVGNADPASYDPPVLAFIHHAWIHLCMGLSPRLLDHTAPIG